MCPHLRTLLLAGALAGVGLVHAAAPAVIQKGYEAAAREAAQSFNGFSAERGAQFFQARHGNDWSCASCHTANPMRQGRHTRTSKAIAPLAPAANAERFTDAANVEKWFRRNCNDVVGRERSAGEKADVLAWLTTLKK